MPGQGKPLLIIDRPIAVVVSPGGSLSCSAADSFAQELVNTSPLTPMLHSTLTEDNTWPTINTIEKIAHPACQSSERPSVALFKRQRYISKFGGLSAEKRSGWVESTTSVNCNCMADKSGGVTRDTSVDASTHHVQMT